MLGIVAFAIAGIGSLAISSSAQAADGTPVVQNTISCTPQIGGSYPMNGHYFFCGADTARKQPMIDAAIAFMTAFPTRTIHTSTVTSCFRLQLWVGRT